MNALKGSYEYISVNDQAVRFTEKNNTGISYFEDSRIVFSCGDSVCYPIFIGYKKGSL